MDNLTAGTITVVFSSMIALMRPLKSLTNVNAQFQRGMAACQTLFTILDSEQEKDEGKRVIERATGDVEFRNVTFTYPGRDMPALRNINLKIPAGKTVALVGRSGSGKSTIASLITRFYDIDEGEILMDGHDLREYTLASLVSFLFFFPIFCRTHLKYFSEFLMKHIHMSISNDRSNLIYFQIRLK